MDRSLLNTALYARQIKTEAAINEFVAKKPSLPAGPSASITSTNWCSVAAAVRRLCRRPQLTTNCAGSERTRLEKLVKISTLDPPALSIHTEIEGSSECTTASSGVTTDACWPV